MSPRSAANSQAISGKLIVLEQLADAQVADVGLRGVGVIARDRLDVIAADRDRHLGAEALVDVIDAELSQLIGAFRSLEAQLAHRLVDAVERCVGHRAIPRP